MTVLPPPLVECQPPKEPAKERQITSPRKKIRRVPDPTEEGRAETIQAMIAAHEQGLQRLREGRIRALQARKELDRIRQRDALEMAETREASRLAFSRLNVLKREKQKELRDWVRSIRSNNRETSFKATDQSETDMRTSREGNEDSGGAVLEETKLDPVSQCAKDNSGELSSEAVGLAKKPGLECSGLSQDVTRCQGNRATSEKNLELTNNEQVGNLFYYYYYFFVFT